MPASAIRDEKRQGGWKQEQRGKMELGREGAVEARGVTGEHNLQLVSHNYRTSDLSECFLPAQSPKEKLSPLCAPRVRTVARTTLRPMKMRHVI